MKFSCCKCNGREGDADCLFVMPAYLWDNHKGAVIDNAVSWEHNRIVGSGPQVVANEIRSAEPRILTKAIRVFVVSIKPVQRIDRSIRKFVVGPRVKGDGELPLQVWHIDNLGAAEQLHVCCGDKVVLLEERFGFGLSRLMASARERWSGRVIVAACSQECAQSQRAIRAAAEEAARQAAEERKKQQAEEKKPAKPVVE